MSTSAGLGTKRTRCQGANSNDKEIEPKKNKMTELVDPREDEYFQEALKLVKEAGHLVREAFSKPRGSGVMTTKTSDVDLVTETDKKVEDLLVDGLSLKFPQHKFIGEESASEGKKTVFSDDPTWIIDPIDGTTNFVHRMPFVAICVGLTVKKQLRAGIVYNPILDLLYTARAGRGAYKNGFQIHTSGTKDPGRAVVMSTVGSQRQKPVIEGYLRNFQAFMDSSVRGHRSLGSAALNMTYIAEGAADAYVEYGLHCWDIAASGIIVEEAGGVLMDPSGGPLNLMTRRILCASSQELADAIYPKLTHVEYPSEAEVQ